MCIFAGLSLGFSCARSSLLLSLPSLCCFRMFLLGLKCPYLNPVCPYVITNLPFHPSPDPVFRLFFFCSGVYPRPTMAHLWSFLPLSRSPTLTNSHPHPFKPQNIKYIWSITTLTHSPIHVMFLLILLYDT